MPAIRQLLLVFLGAGLGGAVRHAVNLASVRLLGAQASIGTLAINVVGSLVIGILAGHYGTRGRAPDDLWLFLATGILGGFTTFSAFSLDAASLWQRGQPSGAAWYVVGSVGLALVAVLVGIRLGARAF